MLGNYNSYRLFFISIIASLFVIFPDITWLPYDLENLAESDKTRYLLFFVFRYIFYSTLIFLLIKANLQHIKTSVFRKRLFLNVGIAMAGYALYGIVSFILYGMIRHFGSLVLFQFLIISVLSTLMGHIVTLYSEQRKREMEIERLKIENLQSRYDALTNQINPHFFFNSLNGLTTLVRKEEKDKTLTYVNELSDVFRYILQSEKKGLVSLREELAFVKAFSYMMEVRFANKLEYHIMIDDRNLSMKLPVLSILPLLDNVVVHNKIDRDHKMLVEIYLSNKNELVVSNPVYRKPYPSKTNGTGLKNLENRFLLLMNKQIRIENKEGFFKVFLPLK